MSPSSHARTGGTAFDPASSRSAVPGRADAGLPDAMRPGATAPPASPGLRRLASHPVGVAAVAALILALLVEAAPVVGGDLMAQAWWATWASSNRSPVDLGWFGGVPVVSYSLLGPWLGALLGLPLAGILGTVLGAASTTALLGRLHPFPTRWTAAGLVAAGTWAANQWSGRTTFGAGAALGCLALVVVALPRRWTARLGGTVLAALAGATSPVASVFLLLAAAAWWCGGQSDLPRLRVGPAGAWCLAGGALLPLGAARLLGAVSGPQPASNHQMVAALAATGLTYAVVPATQRILRIGVVGTAMLLLATWLIGDPVGSNSVRLVLLFAAPVVVAAARIRGTAIVLAALAVPWLVPPVVVMDLAPRDPGPATLRAQALVGELARRGPVGRIEVVPLHDHEESLFVGSRVPLARGWLRQLDTARNALFYDGSLNAADYLQWLRGAGASYVALPSGRPDWRSGSEAALLRHGVPGLQKVWSDASWQLFQVSAGNVVHGNGVLLSSDRSRLVVDVPAPGRLEIALWWSQWSSVRGPGGCVGPGPRAGWTTLTVHLPGRYVLSGAWRPTGRCR